MASLPSMSQLAGSHGPLFESYWNQLDTKRNGRIDAVSAAAFLKKSQLREPILHKIWEISDNNGRGYLDKQGFFTALRLVSACQNGKEPSVNSLSLSDPPPRLVGMETTNQLQNKWTIEKDDRLRYDQMFQNLQPLGGVLSGEKAKPAMLASKLPVETLGKIWFLSDVDQDGNLDSDEFAVAMRLITLCQAGETLPSTLPPSIIPPTKAAKVAGRVLAAGTPPLQPSPITRSHSPHQQTSSPLPGRKISPQSTPEWIITPEVKAKYDSYFEGIDKDHDGIVSGEEARGLFMASNLPQGILAHIWNLCDVQNTGKLNAEQFALAMYLIAEKVRGKDPPSKELPPNMIPPSVRKQPPVARSVAPTTSTALFPTPASATIGSAVMTSISLSPSTSASAIAVTTSVTSGFDNDFSAIRELDTVTKEIDTIRSEKTKLQEDIKEKQELILQRKVEIESLQGKVQDGSKLRDDLEREKSEAQTLLEQLDSEKAKFEGQIAELKQKCNDEREEIERLKSQLTQQESSKRAQSEELEKLREQFEALQKEEREYKQKVDASSAELEKLQKVNMNIQSDITQVQYKVDTLKEEHHSLTTALALFPPVSTPSSTPSSSVVNINDVGQLSSDLHIPQLSEPDAVSARATAGSSSPVSSISGFSTNSHLEEAGGEEASGKEGDRHQKSDPFGTTGIGDPFAAFSTNTADPFTSAGGGGGFTGRPSDLSAFDPFGPSDPFKTTSSTAPSGGDLFKSDPFSSGTPTSSAATSSADPFSGQDPFSSDIFAPNAHARDSSQTAWSPFSVDPFSSQPAAHTPTASDPFASGDPFTDDLFATIKSSGGNPFPVMSSSGGTSQQWNVTASLSQPGPNATDSERLAWATQSKRQHQKQEEELAKILKGSLHSS